MQQSTPMNKGTAPQQDKLNLRTARTLTEFLDLIEEVKPQIPGTLWFRGQSNASHRLTPGVLRNTVSTTDWMGNPIKPGQIQISSGGGVSGISAERLLEAFKRQARPFLNHVPANDFEWMFIAQHHGLPTRLLDWSTNALVALFFAVQHAKVEEGDGIEACLSFLTDESSEDGFAVFVIDPQKVNHEIYGVDGPIDMSADSDTWIDWVNPMSSNKSVDAPICIHAPHMTTRIKAQSGAFTLHGRLIQPLDYYSALRPHITKIFIPYTSTEAIRDSLVQVGMTESFIYPELDAIARDIVRTETAHFKHSMGNHSHQ
ncbi:FRG domain-containing protein [Pseudomonas koreensis]|uniref:FRG domain-containing protein n=1 Tax=Pseudomonas koreensis TaxID=198620 RepID=A0A9X3B1D3_9PSED|nr:FRG domain-containing protein [Pseudomonas koreensis]MCU7246766.1 FRG domain-containing protein [Pseudomonas koreensis]